MESTITGFYPRIDSPVGDRLRKEINRLYRGAGDEGLVYRLKEELTTEVVREQVAAGISMPNSGCIDKFGAMTWPVESIISASFPFPDYKAQVFPGAPAEFGSIAKIYHLNMLDRRVIVRDHIERKRPFTDALHRVAMAACPDTKIELPGPLTMASFSTVSDDSPYADTQELAFAYADLYNDELRELASEKVPLVQFNEPKITAEWERYANKQLAEEAKIVPELYERVTRGVRTPTSIWTYYGDYDDETLKMLFDVPVNLVGLDFTWGKSLPGLLEKIRPEVPIGIGAVDAGAGRNGNIIFYENPAKLARSIAGLRSYVDVKASLVSSNATLETLPREDAKVKCRIVADTARRVDSLL